MWLAESVGVRSPEPSRHAPHADLSQYALTSTHRFPATFASLRVVPPDRSPPLVHDPPRRPRPPARQPASPAAMRSLRSFTHASRSVASPAEIGSDPIVDDDAADSPPRPPRDPEQSHGADDSDVEKRSIPETPVKQPPGDVAAYPQPSRPGLRRSSRLANADNPASINFEAKQDSVKAVDPNSSAEESSAEPRSLPSDQNDSPRISEPPSGHTPRAAKHSDQIQNIESKQRRALATREAPRRNASGASSTAGPQHTRATRASSVTSMPSDATHEILRPANASRASSEVIRQPTSVPSKSQSAVKRPHSSKADVSDKGSSDDAAELPTSSVMKRQRTRSPRRAKNEIDSQSKPAKALEPVLDDLELRMIINNANDPNEFKAILDASKSRKGSRKLRQLYMDRESDEVPSKKRKTPSAEGPHETCDVQVIQSTDDEAQKPQSAAFPNHAHTRRSQRLTRAQKAEIGREDGEDKVQHLDSSESPVRRRSARARAKRDGKRPTRGDSTPEEIESSGSPEPKSRQRRSSRLRRGTHRDDDEWPDRAKENVEASSRSAAGGMTTRGRTAKEKRKGNSSTSQPLPKWRHGSLRERLRDRTPLIPKTRKSRRFRGTSSSRAKSVSVRRRQSTRRVGVRSTRNMSMRKSVRGLQDNTDEEVIDEGTVSESEDDNHDVDYRSAEEEVLSSEEVEAVLEDSEEDDTDDSEQDMEVEDEDEDQEVDEDDYEETIWREKQKRRQKQSQRRKRTQPRDIFETQGDCLTRREQRERLEFLVQQSADIASHLHSAMAEASNANVKRMDKGLPTSGEESGAGQGTSSALDSRDGIAALSEEAKDTPRGNVFLRKEETFAPPTGKDCELQPHQKEGVDWLLTLDAQGLNAILADEMGLGKTIQAVSFLASLVISGSRGPHLVVAPKNVCEHWAAEVKKWYPTELTVVTHLGSAEDRFENLKLILEEDKFDIMVTSFDYALRDLLTRKRNDGISHEHSRVLRAFRKVEFEYLVVDEAHRLKNDSSKLNMGIRSYGLAQRRLLLTGTPLSNNLKELWSLMNVLNPRIFSSKATFEEWFSAPFTSKTTKRSKVALTHAEQSVIVDRLHTVIRPFFRRRVRADVCPTYTSADEVVIQCPMSALQESLMHHLQRRAKALDAGINNILMAMRAVSNHPFCASDAFLDSDSILAPAQLVSASGKFVFLHYALPRLITSGHRVLIFSQFRRVLDFVEDLLDNLNLRFGRLDGTTASDDRSNGLADFNREGSDIPVFLLTTRAGGVGLNLQSADTVILFDSDWNPSADLQAVSRIQRIGQKRTVHILRLVTERSIDEVIIQTARHKMRTQHVAVGAGKFHTSVGAAQDQKMRQKDLEEFLQRLEAHKYGSRHEPAAATEDSENKPRSVPKSAPPVRCSRTDQQTSLKQWDKQLLRPGEASLKSVQLTPLWVENWVDAPAGRIPKWLKKDADLQGAARAWRCPNRQSASKIYEEFVQSKGHVGAFNKKDRALRARRKVSFADLSDQDGGEEDDPSFDVDEYSDSDPDYRTEAPCMRNETLYAEAVKNKNGQQGCPGAQPAKGASGCLSALVPKAQVINSRETHRCHIVSRPSQAVHATGSPSNAKTQIQSPAVRQLPQDRLYGAQQTASSLRKVGKKTQGGVAGRKSVGRPRKTMSRTPINIDRVSLPGLELTNPRSQSSPAVLQPAPAKALGRRADASSVPGRTFSYARRRVNPIVSRQPRQPRARTIPTQPPQVATLLRGAPVPTVVDSHLWSSPQPVHPSTFTAMAEPGGSLATNPGVSVVPEVRAAALRAHARTFGMQTSPASVPSPLTPSVYQTMPYFGPPTTRPGSCMTLLPTVPVSGRGRPIRRPDTSHSRNEARNMKPFGMSRTHQLSDRRSTLASMVSFRSPYTSEEENAQDETRAGSGSAEVDGSDDDFEVSFDATPRLNRDEFLDDEVVESTPPRKEKSPVVVDLCGEDEYDTEKEPERVGQRHERPVICIDVDAESDAKRCQSEAYSEKLKEGHFPALVEKLQGLTKVSDIDFLVDALLACDDNVESAAEFISSRIG